MFPEATTIFIQKLFMVVDDNKEEWKKLQFLRVFSLNFRQFTVQYSPIFCDIFCSLSVISFQKHTVPFQML